MVWLFSSVFPISRSSLPQQRQPMNNHPMIPNTSFQRFHSDSRNQGESQRQRNKPKSTTSQPGKRKRAPNSQESELQIRSIETHQKKAKQQSAPTNKKQNPTTESNRRGPKKSHNRKSNQIKNLDFTGSIGLDGVHQISVPEIPVVLPQLHLVHVRLRRRHLCSPKPTQGNKKDNAISRRSSRLRKPTKMGSIQSPPDKLIVIKMRKLNKKVSFSLM